MSAGVSGVRPLPRATILLVDGDDRERSVLAEALSSRYDVLEASGAVRAAEILASPPLPDLVVCTVRLPDFDGCLFAKRIRSHERFRRIPFVFITPAKDVDAMLRALSAGAHRCLERPVSIDRLLKVVSAVDWTAKEPS